ncbi:hypothetical protein Tco_1486547 [Tanacetum coccineum]
MSTDMSSDQESENDSWGESEDDNEDLKSDDKRTEIDDDKSINLTKTNDEEETQESDDEFVHTSDDYVPTDDETQDNVKLADEDKADEEIIDAEKIEAKHEEIYQEVASAQVQDEGQVTINVVPATHTEKVDAPPSSSSRSVSSNYSSIFLNLGNISSAETKIISMLDVKVQQEILKIQSSSLLIVPVLIIPKPTVLSSIPKITTEAPTTTISPLIPPFIPILPHLTPIPTPTTTEATTSTLAVPESETLSAIHLRVSDLENKVKQLKNVDHSTLLFATIKSDVPTAVKEYLGTSLGDALHKVLQRHTT